MNFAARCGIGRSGPVRPDEAADREPGLGLDPLDPAQTPGHLVRLACDGPARVGEDRPAESGRTCTAHLAAMSEESKDPESRRAEVSAWLHQGPGAVAIVVVAVLAGILIILSLVGI